MEVPSHVHNYWDIYFSDSAFVKVPVPKGDNVKKFDDIPGRDDKPGGKGLSGAAVDDNNILGASLYEPLVHAASEPLWQMER